MAITIDILRANKAALDAVARATMPKMIQRAQFKPEYDSSFVAPSSKPGVVAQVVLTVIETTGAGRWASLMTMSLRYDVAADGFVWPDDPGQWAVVPYKGIVEAWVDGLSA